MYKIYEEFDWALNLFKCSTMFNEEVPRCAKLCLLGFIEFTLAYYHKFRNGIFSGNSDLFDVPSYIKLLVSEYRILIRHHTVGWNFNETICYAILC